MITTHHPIEIDGITIDIVRKSIKNMHLRIYPPDGRVCVSAPLRMSNQQVCQQLTLKLAWIHKQRARLQNQPSLHEPTLQTGEYHYFLGQRYALNVIENSPKAHVIQSDTLLSLHAKPNATILEKENLLNAWYRSNMQKIVPDLITKWQPVIGVQVASWGCKIMKTRWGSCNTRTHRIWLNLALIKKPIGCLESVLVHEMVHLLEASHNARFYQLMDAFMPHWRVHQQALSE